MAILKIYDQKDPILRTPSRPIERMEHWVLDLANDMYETMLFVKAAGLSANQVGMDYRIVTIHTSQFSGPMINPVIFYKSDDLFHFAEQCASAPGYGFDSGKRSRTIKVAFFDLEGKAQTLEFNESTAVVVQHEIDHLDGILFLDHMDRRLYGR